MSLDLTPEQKATGKANYDQATGDLARANKMKTMAVGGPANPKDPDRRDFLRTGLAVGAVVPASAAVYFGYQTWKGNKAVKTALIGTGDEGGVLVGDHNPEFNEVVAVCDIRPTNLKRIFEGEKAPSPRKGLNNIYGKDTAAKIKQYDDYKQLIADGGEDFSVRSGGRGITARAGHERTFEDALLFLRVEREELRLLLHRRRAAAAPVAAAAEDQSALRLPRERDDALIRNDVPVVLDGFVLPRIPHRHRAAELTIRRFAADIHHAVRPVDHRARAHR